MKRICKFVSVAMAFLTYGGCVARNSILEKKDVQFFKVEEVQGAQPGTLKISGLAFKSAMSVTKVTKEQEGSSITVRVHLGPATPGTSGSFAYELSVPASVNEVRFGDDGAIIWKRGSQLPPPK